LRKMPGKAPRLAIGIAGNVQQILNGIGRHGVVFLDESDGLECSMFENTAE